MPDTTIIHYLRPGLSQVACTLRGTVTIEHSNDPGKVTCFACRKADVFKQAQREPARLPQREMPTLLREVLAESPDLAAINSKAWLARCRNDRGMFTIQEVIHHGDYRSQRFVEVYEINETTVDAVLQSSAYCYGSWAHAEPQFAEHRSAALKQLVQDLRDGVTNRAIGWSTFRLIPNN
jgi:hypothetical protein